MPVTRRSVLGGAAILTLASGARAQDWAKPSPFKPGSAGPVWPAREQFKLWPGLPPGAPVSLPKPNNTMNGPADRRELWLRGIAEPVVAVYRPKKPDGRAVLSIPGGGYQFVSVENEGLDVARMLTPHGITVFVLAYRLPGEGWANRADVPLQDAQRAMRLIRARAANWGIDAAKLGLVGFSAGGHLGAMLAVGHSDKVYAPIDAADALPARPAYAGLVYPAVSFNSAGFEERKENGLWGDSADPATAARYNALARVTAETPPIFLVHAIDDGTVPIQQSLAMIDTCRRAKVPVEAHLLESGGHGFGGMHLPVDAPGRLWPEIFARWTAKH